MWRSLPRMIFAASRWIAYTVFVSHLVAQAALAQQASRVPRVGILSPYGPSESLFQDDIKGGLKDLGYLEGRTIEYETRFAEGKTERLAALAADLVRRRVDIIITTTAPAVRAAMQTTTTIPIVIGGVDDAVEQGFVASLARPGGNVTGTSWFNVELTKKRLELLKEALPGLSRVGVLREAVGAGATARAVMTAGQALDLQVYLLEVRAPNELDDAFAEMSRIGVGAVSVLESPMMTAEGNRVASLALHYRVPAMFPDRRFLKAGGVMSYGSSLPTMYRQAASYVDRILKGTRPADLPVEQPTVFELVISRRSADLLGLSLSDSIFIRADEIIE
jgi:putative tryptophan/tyrosine transport system substrate-binding protein